MRNGGVLIGSSMGSFSSLNHVPRCFIGLLPERVRTGFLNNLVLAELHKPASQKDKEKSKAIFGAAMSRVISLKSVLRFNEKIRVYKEMINAFPGEKDIKDLGLLIKKW